MFESLIASAVQTWGVPTAMTGLFFWLLKRHIDKQDKARAEQERNREKLDKILIQSTTAALALSEATAKAVQRIPDAHCNGDMSRALEYAATVKHDQKEFLTALGIHALHDN